MKRKIEEQLNQWLSTKYGLIVFGARQVGKTYILKEFLSKVANNHFFYLNLHETPSAMPLIAKARNVEDFLLTLTSLSNKIDIQKNTFIFIDEIQEYYTYLGKHPELDTYFDVISQTKYIVENTKNRIVLSGSLLRLEMNNLITNPTGYLLPLEMYPMDFEEFLWANGISTSLIEAAHKCFENESEVPEYIHTLFLNLYQKYILVGGMPEAVNSFITKNSFVSVGLAHKSIEYFIQEDLTKYVADNEKLKVKDIYKLIPTELSNPSRKFILSDIPKHNKNNNDVLSFSWLNQAGITIPTYITSDPIIPLLATSKRNQFKLFHEDVGLLTYLLFDYAAKSKILAGEIIPNLGAVYENSVAQALFAHGFSDLYYYNSKKFGEVDFLVEKDQLVLPVEVKSGKEYTHRALNNILDIPNYHLSKAICFYNENTKHVGKITYFPIYLSMFLKK